MAQPTWMSDGVTPRRTDPRRLIIAKWLGVIQNSGSPYAVNNPLRTDTRHVLKAKIDAAYSNVPFPGIGCCLVT